MEVFDSNCEDDCDSGRRPEFAEHWVYSSKFFSDEYYDSLMLVERALDGAYSFKLMGYRFVCPGFYHYCYRVLVVLEEV